MTLLGDAIHPMAPVLGQGAGQSLEDASVLASSLRSEPSVPRGLRAYEAQRRGRIAMLVRLARVAEALVTTPVPGWLQRQGTRLSLPAVAAGMRWIIA